MNWYALYVKSRHEFVAHDELSKKSVETFLPVVNKLRRWKDRDKWINFPLFPGYLFVRVLPEQSQFLNVLKTRGVITLLASQPGYPTPVPPEEISSLKVLVESGRDVDIYPHLREGSNVRVKKGPLAGAEGILEKKNDNFMLLVNVDLLGRSVGVKMYADDVEAA